MPRLMTSMISSPRSMLLVVVVVAAALIATQYMGGGVTIPDLSPAGAETADTPYFAESSSVAQTTATSATVTDQSTASAAPVATVTTTTASAVSTGQAAIISAPGEPEPGLHPTSSWFNVFGESAMVNGLPVQPGDVISAYDSDGTLAGRFIVKTEGQYGVMAIYEDDPTTPVDEGTEPGDQISFEINGLPATVLGPETPTWNESGTLLRLNLIAGQASITIGR